MADALPGAPVPHSSAVPVDSQSTPKHSSSKPASRRAPLPASSIGNPAALHGLARVLLKLRGTPAPAEAGDAGRQAGAEGGAA
jgi:hypothetical protein